MQMQQKREVVAEANGLVELRTQELAAATQQTAVARARLASHTAQRDHMVIARNEATRKINVLQLELNEVEKRVSEKEEAKADLLSAAKAGSFFTLLLTLWSLTSRTG